MIMALQNEGNSEKQARTYSKRVSGALQIKNKKLEYFVTTESMILFQLLELAVGILAVDSDFSESREHYKQANEIIITSCKWSCQTCSCTYSGIQWTDNSW